MNGKELSIVALKAFALYILVEALLNVPIAIQSAGKLAQYAKTFTGVTNEFRALAVIGIALLVVAAIVGVFVWKLADSIVTKSIATTDHAFSKSTYESILFAVLIGIGLFLSIRALVDLAHGISALYWNLNKPPPEYYDQYIATMQATIVVVKTIELLLGMSLVFATRWWVKVLPKPAHDKTL